MQAKSVLTFVQMNTILNMSTERRLRPRTTPAPIFRAGLCHSPASAFAGLRQIAMVSVSLPQISGETLRAGLCAAIQLSHATTPARRGVGRVAGDDSAKLGEATSKEVRIQSLGRIHPINSRRTHRRRSGAAAFGSDSRPAQKRRILTERESRFWLWIEKSTAVHYRTVARQIKTGTTEDVTSLPPPGTFGEDRLHVRGELYIRLPAELQPPYLARGPPVITRKISAFACADRCKRLAQRKKEAGFYCK